MSQSFVGKKRKFPSDEKETKRNVIQKVSSKPLSLQWVQQHEYWFRTKAEADSAYKTSQGEPLPSYLTHTMPTGGVLKIPEQKMSLFLRACAADLEQHKSIYYYERMLERHRFVLDFDFDSVEPKKQWMEYVWHIQAVLKRFYPDQPETITAVVCESSKTSCTGLHVRFPYCVVNLDICRSLYSMILKTLIEQFGERKTKPWSFVVDKSIFSGCLRMLGAKKVVPCLCQKKNPGIPPSEIVCEMEPCSGWSHPPYVYSIRAILNDKGQEMDQLLQSLQGHWDKQLAITTIFVPSNVHITPCQIPADCPKSVSPPPSPEGEKKETKSTQLSERVSDTKTKFHAVNIDVQSTIGISIRDAIRAIHQEYTAIDVSAILKSQDKEHQYLVKVKGVGAHFCLNKNGNHNSSTIYFILHKPSIGNPFLTQRCYSSKDFHGVVCKTFRSQAFALMPSLSKQLFTRTTRCKRLSSFQGTIDDLICNSAVYLLSKGSLLVDTTEKVFHTQDRQTSGKKHQRRGSTHVKQ